MTTIYQIRRRNAQELAKRIGGSQRFADRVGMHNRQQASHIIGRTQHKNIGNKLARKIEQAFNMPHGWLDQDHKVNGSAMHATSEGFVRVPLLSSYIGGEDAGEVASCMELSRDWVRQHTNASAFDYLAISTARGDAMAPKIEDGSIMLIDRGVTKADVPDVYALLVGESILARRLQPKLDGGLTVLCDNPRYEAEAVDAKGRAKLMIVGRVLSAFTPQKL